MRGVSLQCLGSLHQDIKRPSPGKSVALLQGICSRQLAEAVIREVYPLQSAYGCRVVVVDGQMGRVQISSQTEQALGAVRRGVF
jgi:hypothetical protein